MPENAATCLPCNTGFVYSQADYADILPYGGAHGFSINSTRRIAMPASNALSIGQAYDAFVNDEPDQFIEAATQALSDWQSCCDLAGERIRQFLPLDLHPKGFLFLQILSPVGVCWWAYKCHSRRPEIATIPQLRKWCVFQFELLRATRDFECRWNVEEDGRSLSWTETLKLGAPLVFGWESEPTPGELEDWVRRLCLTTFHRRRFAFRPMDDDDLTAMARHLWDAMRKLGNQWPAEPARLTYTAECDRALEEVIRWCDDQVEAPVPSDIEKYEEQPLRPESGGEWSEPDSPTQWAKRFNVSYKTVKFWLDEQIITNQRLSPRRYRVAKKDLS